jgi:spore germination protein GerM
MAFLHPIRHLPKMNLDMLILMVATLLLLLALVLINFFNPFPRERAVPQPVVASPNLPIRFSKLQGSQSITEVTYRSNANQSQASSLRSALEQLLAGPNAREQSQGYYSEIPKGTDLLGLKVHDNALQINLSKEFISGGGSTSIIQRVNELKETVYALQGNRKIEIVIEGQPLETIGGEGLEIN